MCIRDRVHSIFVDYKPDCGPFDPAVKAALFGDFAKRIASAVMMPLGYASCKERDQKKIGILVFGSTRADSFKSGMGTMFLVQCAELITATMGRDGVST